MPKLRRMLLVVAIAVIAIAGCRDSDDASTSTEPDPAATAAAPSSAPATTTSATSVDHAARYGELVGPVNCAVGRVNAATAAVEAETDADAAWATARAVLLPEAATAAEITQSFATELRDAAWPEQVANDVLAVADAATAVSIWFRSMSDATSFDELRAASAGAPDLAAVAAAADVVRQKLGLPAATVAAAC